MMQKIIAALRGYGMRRREVIVQGKSRKDFMKEGHLRGSLSEFWRHVNKDLGQRYFRESK